MRILDLATLVQPFGDPVGELPIADLPMAAARLREVELSRIAPERLAFADYAFASAPMLAAFARVAPKGRPSALAVSADSPLASLAPVSSARRQDGLVIFDVYLDAHGTSLEALRSEATPVLVPHRSAIRLKPLPRVGPGPYALPVPADGVVVAHLEHWCHWLWTIPLLVPLWLSRGGRRFRSPGARAPSVLLGKKHAIHPRAFLEGSVIGAEVEIDGGCSIRGSYVGPGCRLADLSKLAYSVIGAGTNTLVDANLAEVVALGGGTLTNLLLKETMLGRQVFLTTGVIFWTDPLFETVRVEHRGASIDTGRWQLGGCAGHGAILGARTILAPGQALPNRVTVVMRKEEGVQRVAEAPPGTPMCWDQAALVPVEQLLPGYAPEELS